MAQFKKTPNADSAPGLFDAEAFGQFAMSYWPAVLGGLVFVMLIARGKKHPAIAVGIAVAFLQLWVLSG